MAEDVSVTQQWARQGVPLSDGEQARLRELSGKAQLTDLERYERGSLRGRGRTTAEGRRVLDDVAHEQLGRPPSSPARRRSNPTLPKQVQDAIAAAVDRAAQTWDR